MKQVSTHLNKHQLL